MSQTTVNPYGEIGGQIPTGLVSIIGALPGSPTIDNLVTTVYNYVQPIYYPAPSGGSVPTQVTIELKSIARTAINSYVNSLVTSGKAGYNGNQFAFIGKLLGITMNLPIVSINDRIGNLEDLVSESNLTVSEQTPILLATTIGVNANSYWSHDVQLGSPVWATYYPPAPENYMDLPFYTEAAINGALAGYGATPDGMVEPSVNYVTAKMVSALIGALTVTAGKLVFKWIARVQPGSVTANNTVNLGSGPAPFRGGGNGEVTLWFKKNGNNSAPAGKTWAEAWSGTGPDQPGWDMGWSTYLDDNT